ncbi:hepatitis A virus cellular receptor 1 isoform X1 [Scleropages formosus]|uniref:hepatitis A virus cellular receptor 1 isoform X1 n=2 Tax=Scleropages formosus TaxID=113540 RepID=UPI0010FA9412|nr:hepatitis A virus cellular receptor 1 homolog isoform X1 [Scleropages formosus]
MITYHRYISLWSLFCCTWASSGHAVTVRTLVGQSVTLPCSYDVAYHGPLHICWGRGEIPINGCNHQIIETDGYKVKRRVSDRYQLFGDLAKGDVSLTIVDANERDGGKYGCRVEIHGLFNDEKKTVDLIVEKTEEPTTTTTTGSPSTTCAAVTTQRTTSAPTQCHEDVNVTEISDGKKNGENVLLHPLEVLRCLQLSLVCADDQAPSCCDSDNRGVARGGGRRAPPAPYVTEQYDNTSVYVNLGTSLGLNIEEMTVENIYECDSSNQYEFCP